MLAANPLEGKRRPIGDQSMRGKSILLSIILVATLSVPAVFASALEVQDQNANKTKLHVPQRGRRRHRDSKHRGIGHAYKNAGKSAGRGGKRFGKNVAHGKPVKGGKELGKGMGGFGKGVGQGTSRAGKKVGGKIKHAVTP
jgi:hypothetical protein